MKHEFEVFPCSKNCRLKKGFCPCICSAVDMLDTISNWRKFSSRFGIKYYAFRLVGEEHFVISKI